MITLSSILAWKSHRQRGVGGSSPWGRRKVGLYLATEHTEADWFTPCYLSYLFTNHNLSLFKIPIFMNLLLCVFSLGLLFHL